MTRAKKTAALLLAVLIVMSLAVPTALAEGTYYLTWDEYKEANQITSWNYNDQAAVIAAVANHAVELYEAGNTEEA